MCANGLFFFAAHLDPAARTARALSLVLTSELWHQQLGHPGMHQLQHLPSCTVGVPPGAHQSVHPLHTCPICEHAKHRRANKGSTNDLAGLTAGSRFHIDFGFLRASDSAYRRRPSTAVSPPSDTSRVVQSVDGFTSYMLVVCAVLRYTWVFLTASKALPVPELCALLGTFGKTHGYRALRVDQGGELWHSSTFRYAAAKSGYVVEPTGSDSAWMNGKVERLNGTFGVMVRAMLYGAGLPPKFWSFALLHAAYIKNRMWHSALGHTPFEALNGSVPDLSHLRVFGSRLYARMPGQPRAKLDDHVADGIFLGFHGSSSTVRYFDLRTGAIKTGGSFVFDEAHYASSDRPPGPHLLYTLGLDSQPPPRPSDNDCVQPPHAPLPPIAPKAPHKDSLPCQKPLPLAEFASFAPPAAAAAARVDALQPSVDAVMSIELAGDPFGPSFCHEVPLRGDHPSLGFVLSPDPD